MADATVNKGRSSVGQTLLSCLQHWQDGRPVAASDLPDPGWNGWGELCRAAHWHGILPLVRKSLSSAPAGLVPAAVLRLLDRESRSIAARNLAVSSGLAEVVDLLRRNSIRAIPWKGPALGAFAYGTPCLRDFTDVDLLVPPADAARAVALLASHGYVPRGAAPEPCEAPNADGPRHISLTRPQSPMVVDLQWELTRRWDLPPVSCGLSLDFEALWERREAVHLCGGSLPHVAAEELLLILSVHGARHYWCRLIWICDVAAAVRACPNIDWGRVLEAAGQLRCRRRLSLALHLAHELLGAEVPGWVRAAGSFASLGGIAAWVKQEVLRGATARKQDETGDNRLSAWLSDIEDVAFAASVRDRFRDRAAFWLGVLIGGLMPNEEDRQVVHLPGRFSLAYGLIRPARLIRSYGFRFPLHLLRVLTLGVRRNGAAAPGPPEGALPAKPAA